MIKYIVNCVNIINHIQNNVTSVTNVDKYLPAYNDNIKSIVNEILADNNMESLNLIEGFDSLLLRYIISSLIVFSKSNKVGGGKKTKKKKLSKKNKKGGSKTNDLSKLYLTSILNTMLIFSFLDNKINNVSESLSNYIEKHNNNNIIMRGGAEAASYRFADNVIRMIRWIMEMFGISWDEAVEIIRRINPEIPLGSTGPPPPIVPPPRNVTLPENITFTFTDQRMEPMRGTLTYDNVVLPISASALASYFTNSGIFNSTAAIQGISNITNALPVSQLASTSLFPSYTLMIIIGGLIVAGASSVALAASSRSEPARVPPADQTPTRTPPRATRAPPQIPSQFPYTPRRDVREGVMEEGNLLSPHTRLSRLEAIGRRSSTPRPKPSEGVPPPSSRQIIDKISNELVDDEDQRRTDGLHEGKLLPVYNIDDEDPENQPEEIEVENFLARLEADPVWTNPEYDPFSDVYAEGKRGGGSGNLPTNPLPESMLASPQLELTDSNLSTTSSSGSFHTPRRDNSEFTTPRQYVRGMPVGFHQSAIDYKNLCKTKPKFTRKTIKFSRYFPNYGRHARECDDYPDNRYLNYDLNTGKYCCENTPNSREDFENFFHNVNRSYYEVPEEIRTKKYPQYPGFLENIRIQYNIPPENIGGKRNKTKRRKNTKKRKKSSKKK